MILSLMLHLLVAYGVVVNPEVCHLSVCEILVTTERSATNPAMNGSILHVGRIIHIQFTAFLSILIAILRILDIIHLLVLCSCDS